jgi:hypothetical protein
MGVKTGSSEKFENKLLTRILLSVTAEVIMALRQNAKLLYLTWTTEFRRLTMRILVPTHTSIQADGSLLEKKESLIHAFRVAATGVSFTSSSPQGVPHSCMTEQPHVKHLQL